MVEILDPSQVSGLGRYIYAGRLFAFVDFSSEDLNWLHLMLNHRRVVIPLLGAAGPLLMAGARIDPLLPPPLSLRGVVTPREHYGPSDAVHLLAFQLLCESAQTALVLECNDEFLSRNPIHFNRNGLALLSLRDLPEGRYQAYLESCPDLRHQFQVGNYSLPALEATLLHREFDATSHKLRLRLGLQRFGSPLSGPIKVQFAAGAQRLNGCSAMAAAGVVTLEVTAVEKAMPTDMLIECQEAPRATTRLSLKDPLASIPPPVVLSTLGGELKACSQSAETSVEVRGLHLVAGPERPSPFLLERGQDGKVSLICRQAAELVTVAIHGSSENARPTAITRAECPEGTVIEFEVPDSIAVVAIGAFIGRNPWEGWAVLLSGGNLNPRLEVPALVAPGSEVTIKVQCPGNTASLFLTVQDVRQVREQSPAGQLTHQLRTYLDGIQQALGPECPRPQPLHADPSRSALAEPDEDPFANDPFASPDDAFQVANPFAVDPFGEGDPFAGIGGPAGLDADPFASQADPFANQADPFADQADPFADQADPFASQADPFASQADPFANQADPFASQADPFANQADPFASPADPFANPADPFASQADPFANQADPFANQADPFANQADPFADPFASPDPFGANTAGFAPANPFSSPDPFGPGGPFAPIADPFASGEAMPSQEVSLESEPDEDAQEPTYRPGLKPRDLSAALKPGLRATAPVAPEASRRGLSRKGGGPATMASAEKPMLVRRDASSSVAVDTPADEEMAEVEPEGEVTQEMPVPEPLAQAVPEPAVAPESVVPAAPEPVAAVEPEPEPAPPPAARPEPVAPVARSWSECVHCSLLELEDGQAEIRIRLPGQPAEYQVTGLVVDGLDWAPLEARLAAYPEPLAWLEVPAHLAPGDDCRGRLAARAQSGKFSVALNLDGQAVPLSLRGQPMLVPDVVSAEPVDLQFTPSPGHLEATVTDPSSRTETVSEATICKLGTVRRLARSIHFLNPGQTLEANGQDILELKLVQGFTEVSRSLLADWACRLYGNCLAEAARVVSAAVWMALDPVEAESHLRAGIERLRKLWLPGAGLRLYPGDGDVPDTELGPKAARILRSLMGFNENSPGMTNHSLRAIRQGLTMSQDAEWSYGLEWPPGTPAGCQDAYYMLTEHPDTAPKAIIPWFRDWFTKIQGAKISRTEMSYAAACCLRLGRGSWGRALQLSRPALQALDLEPGLRSPLELAATASLLHEFMNSTLLESGMVEIKGKPVPVSEAALQDAPTGVRCTDGVVAVLTTRWVQEDWLAPQSTVKLKAVLQGSAQGVCQPGQRLSLRVAMEGDSKAGDSIWVFLPECMLRVGTTPESVFAVQTLGKNQVDVELVATRPTQRQKLLVVLRNSLTPSRRGTTLLDVKVVSD